MCRWRWDLGSFLVGEVSGITILKMNGAVTTIFIVQCRKFFVSYLFLPAAVSSAPLKQQPTAKVESDSEEEIDFGFWEKATPIPRTDVKEVDLNLL